MIAGNSVGIDYHQDSVTVAVIGKNREVVGTKRLASDVGAVYQYVNGLGAVESVAIEACTGSAVFGEDLRDLTGWKVNLCHPGYVGRMRHNPDKSDKSDAYLLGDLNRVGYLPQVWLAPEGIRDLRALIRYRKQVVGRCRDLKLRIRAILRQNRVRPPTSIKGLWGVAGLGWLNRLDCFSEHTQWIMKRHLSEHAQQVEELKVTEKRMKAVAKEDRMVNLLLEQRGIGLVTAVALRAEIGVFSRFRTGKQLSRYCGVTPRNCSSGERQADSGLIKAGNAILKTVIIEASHGLMRYDKEWNKFAVRLMKQGKPYSVAAAAVANRWIRRLFYLGLELEKKSSQKA